MIERPFQGSVNDKVRIAPDGRSVVRVLVEAQREMPQRFGGIASLFEGAEHPEGNDAFLGLAHDLSNEPLVMLRRNSQFRAGERDLHATLPAMTVGIGPAGFWGRRNTPVAHA